MRESTRLLVVLSLVVAGSATAQDSTISCRSTDDHGESRYPDLYCIDLIPVPGHPRVEGVARLIPPSSPFGTAVTPDGVQRYRVRVEASGLPSPEDLGSYTVYVAWAAPPTLHPYIRLGPVENGTADLGEVSLNKFTVMVTAEPSSQPDAPTGPIVMRGQSPSHLLQPHDLLSLSPLAAFSAREDEDSRQHAHEDAHARAPEHNGWSMPPMHPLVPMAPGMAGVVPAEDPYLPFSDAPDRVPFAQPRTFVELADGDSLVLVAGLVQRKIKDKTLFMYAFNRQYPGPLIYVSEAATIQVQLENELPHPTAVHWHGVRLENRFDGVPGVTQEPVLPGEAFQYTVHFPDAGLYWYHPHHREDIQLDLGLYGNIVVRPDARDHTAPVNREEVLMLDDLLLGEEGLVPYGERTANFALMGRFGNILLINGEPEYNLTVQRGEVVRFYLTNVANTRPFNLDFEGSSTKAVASDLGKYERETMVESVVISPAERYIVDVHFPEAGTFYLLNRVQGLNHRTGAYFAEVDTLGAVTVERGSVRESHREAFFELRENRDVVADIDQYRAEFSRRPDKKLQMTVEVEGIPEVVRQMMRLDPIYFNPVEWIDTMPMMNWISTGNEVTWKLRDVETGKENMEIDWTFARGDIVKVLVENDRNAFHAMQHPLHVHGQRFLVLSVDGVPNEHLVWKDTVLLPVGTEAELLLDLSNPGKWMVHCHIAEHLDSGMMMIVDVTE